MTLFYLPIVHLRWIDTCTRPPVHVRPRRPSALILCALGTHEPRVCTQLVSVRVDRPDRRRPRPIFDTPNGAGLLALSLLEGENHLVGGDVAVLGFRISNGLP